MDLSGLVSKLRTKLEDETKLRAFSPGAIARGLLGAYNESALEIADSLDLKIINATVSVSAGDSLDSIGVLVGVDREGSSYALGQVKIYIDSASSKTEEDLKDIVEEKTGTRPTTLTLPAGTEVTNESGTKLYTTVNNVIIGDDPVFVDVLSSNVGEAGNANSGELNLFGTFSPDIFSISPYILVTNPVAVDSGSEAEEDDNYRFKIVNSFVSNAAANDISIRLATLSVAGVADAEIRNYEYGIGTTAVYVISESPIISQGVLNAVQQAVNNVGSSGNRIVAAHFDYKAMNIELSLEFIPGTSVGDKDDICIEVEDVVIEYINALTFGDDFIFNELTQRVMEVSEKIYDYEFLIGGIGEYNFSTGLIDYYQPILPVNQPIDETAKWVTNSKLINICY